MCNERDMFLDKRDVSVLAEEPKSAAMQSCPWGEIMARTEELPETIIKTLGTKCDSIFSLGDETLLAVRIKQLLKDPLFTILWPPSLEHATRYFKAAEIMLVHGCKTILDAGCGPGDGTLMLSRLIPESKIIGVDHDPNAFQKNSKMAKLAENERISFGATDLFQEDSLGNKIFDGITAFEILEHLDEPTVGVRRFAKALKHNGVFIASCPSLGWLPEGKRNSIFNPPLNPDHPNEPTKLEFQDWLQESFEDVTILGQGVCPKQWAPYTGLLQLLEAAKGLAQLQGSSVESIHRDTLITHNTLRRMATWTFIDNNFAALDNSQEAMTLIGICRKPKL